MTTLLHAVARKADAFTPDADLLTRFAHAADHAAFEALVHRHGPLVWAVCRQTLPEPADAEDAFQAVFLALVRSAGHIRDGRALPAWLHGVAVRVAARVRRQGARHRACDRAAARPEADRPVPDAAWERLVATVHEEVQRLPEAERTAFVLCELQGVSQPDAAARLGCPLGSVSGRLCKARQKLLERLTARGIAPAAVVGVGLTAGSAAALPAKLFDAVRTFPVTPAASGAVVALARAVTEGVTMRLKLTFASAVVAAALGITGGAAVLSTADAQPPDVVREVKGLLGGADKTPPAPGGGPGLPPPGAGSGLPLRPDGRQELPPGAPGGLTGFAPGGMPGMGGTVAPAQWEYKFVDVPSDRKEFEKAISQNGKEGWEFAGSERFAQNNLTLVFKKRTGAMTGVGVGGPGGMGGPFGGGGGRAGGAGGPGGRIEVEVGGVNPLGAGGWGQWGGKDGVEVRSFTLKNASAADVGAALTKALAKGALKAAIPEPGTNRILVVADTAAMKDVVKIVEDLEARPGRGPGAPGGDGGRPAPGGPVGGSGSGGPPGFGPRSGGSIPGGEGPMGTGAGGPPRAVGGLTVLTLKHALAGETATLLKRVFPAAEVTADDRTNQLVVRADAKTLEELQALLVKLDVQVPKSR